MSARTRHILGVGALHLRHADEAVARAEGLQPLGAELALHAGRERQRGDAVADLPVAGYAGSDRRDRPGEFMAKDGSGLDEAVFGDMQVGAADPAMRDLEHDLSLGRLRIGNRLDRQRLPRALEDRGFHAHSP